MSINSVEYEFYPQVDAENNNKKCSNNQYLEANNKHANSRLNKLNNEFIN